MVGFRRLAVLAVALLAVPLSQLSPADADPAPPQLVSSAASVLRGGGAVAITATGLTPDTDYAVQTTVGTVHGNGEPVDRATTDVHGSFRVYLIVDTTVALSVTGATVSVPGDPTASVTVAIADPVFGASYAGGVCPGRAFQVSSGGFPDGQWTVTSDALLPSTSTVTATAGQLPLAARLADTLPATATVHVAAADGSGSFDYDLHRASSYVNRQNYLAYFDWAEHLEIGCLRPGELVTFSSSSSRSIAPAPVHADSLGYATMTVDHRPVTAPSRLPGITFLGRSSGQSGTTDTVAMWGTTLPAGQRLSPRVNGLVSPNGTWVLGFEACTLTLWQRSAGQFQARAWQPVRGPASDLCHAAMSATGDFVISNPSGRPLWSSQTAGTGSRNRLVLRDDGNLVVYTAANRLVWTSSTGIVRTASTLGARQVLTRGQSLVRGATRLRLRKNGVLAVERAGRTLWQTRGTKRKPLRGAVRAELTRAGRLVLRNRSGVIVWSNRGGLETTFWPHLSVTATGDVVITGAPREVLWHTRTSHHGR